MKHIVLTGGGTAGHVTPNIALVPALREAGYEISYIGSYDGIERKLIEELNIPYYGISSGKLRRYFDLKNFTDPFRLLKGFREARKLLKQLKPDVVFSKGGFVTVPVVIAAKRCKINDIEGFKKRLENTKGDTIQEKIDNLEEEINEEYSRHNERTLA